MCGQDEQLVTFVSSHCGPIGDVVYYADITCLGYNFVHFRYGVLPHAAHMPADAASSAKRCDLVQIEWLSIGDGGILLPMIQCIGEGQHQGYAIACCKSAYDDDDTGVRMPLPHLKHSFQRGPPESLPISRW